jgi:hypothetical protein
MYYLHASAAAHLAVFAYRGMAWHVMINSLPRYWILYLMILMISAFLGFYLMISGFLGQASSSDRLSPSFHLRILPATL